MPKKKGGRIWMTSSSLLQYHVRWGIRLRSLLCAGHNGLCFHALSLVYFSAALCKVDLLILTLFSDNDSSSSYYLMNTYHEARTLVLYIIQDSLHDSFEYHNPLPHRHCYFIFHFIGEA